MDPLVDVKCPRCGKLRLRCEGEDSHVHEIYCRSRDCKTVVLVRVRDGRSELVDAEHMLRPAAVRAAPLIQREQRIVYTASVS